MKPENGNALFLILIAVALFAALSYAITSSDRGGGSIDKERAEILAAQIFDQVALMQSGYTRLKVIGGYDQILFDDSAETTTGTCYDGGNAVSAGSCHTIGLFNPDSGISPPGWTEEMRDPAYVLTDTNIWNWNLRRLYLNGVDVGTSASDEYVVIRVLRDEVCEAINRKVNNDPAINAFTLSANPDGLAKQAYDVDGTFGALIANTSSTTSAPDLPNTGCLEDAGGRSLGLFILKEN